ncbi:hypothetical protein [Caulobacter sp. 17J65-9]|uniref:hypothetical protein n=1 Tax=Caulobacter sp. 17J65-9 TaxID=2709382 RepID=UPI0013C682A7|nr:hypothetical protein [Caulobacter sp. 17J65-9]NEX92967.1 hypothetical protein [Caulobacter sp. 17J65-9]
MTEVPFYPRLHAGGLARLIDERSEVLATTPWRELRDAYAGWISHGTTGGTKVDDARLDAIRNRLLEIATAYGFPDRSGRSDRAGFDAACAIALVTEDFVSGPDAWRDDVWSFLAAVLAPDLVQWRFDQAPIARYRGGVRNTLQRLWLRGVAFDRGEQDGRWDLLRRLSEDAHVQIIERPGLSASPVIARALGESWLATLETRGAPGLEGITRRAVRNVLVSKQVLSLESLDPTALRAETDRQFGLAAGVV